MITFLTLYLGLVTGTQPVEVVVAASVELVELRLDGELVAQLDSASWRTHVDFGEQLIPRRLTAIAFDGEHTELGRADQLINVPRGRVEAGLVLEQDSAGKVEAARVSWQSLERARPLQVTATLDGQELAVTDFELIEIPDYDRSRFHVLTVELEFTARQRTQIVASFGGAYLNEVSTELTALPVTPRKRRMPSLSDIQGSVSKDGKALSIVAIDEGPADLVIVRDTAADAAIADIGRRGADGLGGVGVSSPTGVSEGVSSIGGITASAEEELRRTLTLDEDYRVRLLWSATKLVEREEVRMELFPASPSLSASDGGVYWALTQRVALDGASQIQRLADAVAVAGLEAAAENRRRAVILVLAPDAVDESRYTPANVRDFLHSLSVPLYVWLIAPEGTAAPQEWGDATTLPSLVALRRAVREVKKDLERQRILWLEGRHLPQRLNLPASTELAPVGP